MACPAAKKKEPQREAEPPKWIPPPMGCTKVNVDAAVSKNTGRAAIAAVAREANGDFLGASTMALVGMTEPETLEALAVKEGLCLASDLLLRSFRVACDNSSVVRNIAGAGTGLYGHIVQEIKARARGFTLVEFVHEGRRSNGDAHILARSSMYDDIGRHVWLLAPPEGVCNSYHLND